MLNDKTILITGGTGSFGTKFVETVLKQYKPKKLIIYSRDELKQYNMHQAFREHESRLRFFIGDVRDAKRMTMAMEGVDIVIHAAALKQVPAAEYNPFECIKTNVLGAQNIIDAAMSQGVEKIIALSTDKAAAPINLYGATKLCSDKLFVAANNYKGDRDLKLSVVRYGNVMGSRGSVIPFFLKVKEQGHLPITHENMTRFNITLEQGVEFTLACLNRMWGGEIFVPKIPSYRIVDVAQAVAPGLPIKIVGVRPGEKLHEEMITETDAINSLEFDNYFVILPSFKLWDIDKFANDSNQIKGQFCSEGFSYNSGTNPHFLSVEELSELIQTHCPSQE
ncbi:MAG: UDP-N-acetylglucosamine 4,6-dehydratase (inverting) [Oligoflexus sp.]